MSEKIYNRAKLYVDKILYIFSVMDKCPGLKRNNGDYYYYPKFRYREKDISWRSNGSYGYTVFASTTNEGWRKSKINHWIDGTGRNSMIDSDRDYMNITEYSEDIDFMLSTLYNDNELLEYYISSLLYTSGFRGYVRKGISHNTLNAFIKHADGMYEDRDRIWNNIRTTVPTKSC